MKIQNNYVLSARMVGRYAKKILKFRYILREKFELSLSLQNEPSTISASKFRKFGEPTSSIYWTQQMMLYFLSPCA